MAFAEVVRRFASTNSTSVAAYAPAGGAIRHVHPRRACGSAISRNTAAAPERKLATCQAVSVAALIAAPPVENSNAAAASSSRFRTGEDSITGTRLLYRIRRVIRTAHQRPRFHVREAHLHARAPQLVELRRRYVPHDRQMFRRRP